MKSFKIFAILLACFSFLQATAQTENPKGFKKGTLVLSDGSSVTGIVKDNIRKDASVTFAGEAGQKKKTYNGSDLAAAEIDGVKFICIKGDFFKVLCEGDISFLQKSSDASDKPIYNGSEAFFVNGTDGKPSDYFIYNNADKELKLVSKKNVDEVTRSSFGGCIAAVEKAKTINGDLSQLKGAVEVYNNRNK